ncbi:MAG: glycosyltransferase family 2 protein [Proteobacteria bacterium]|nr:glycosyltransferase family 2 protein [Pseudomonadota bacterium]
MTWLSLLVPVYNVQPYLEECLASVIDQLPADGGVQVLVLDDCSTDGSWALMQELDKRWPGRLRLLQHQRNGGLSAARNTMIDVAVGDYLWFLDSDDKLLPGAIAGLQAIVRQHAPDMVLCDFSVWREQVRFKHRLRGEAHKRSFAGPARRLVRDHNQLAAGMLRTGQLHAWSKISRRALWGAADAAGLRFPVARYFEDMATMPRLALRAESYFYEPAPWVAYRQRGSSILATMTMAKALDQSTALLALMRDLQARSEPLDEGLRFALAHQAARSLMGAMRHVCRGQLQDGSQPPSAVAEQLRRNFRASSPLTPEELARAYLVRGWWLRWRKFLRWFHAAPKP